MARLSPRTNDQRVFTAAGLGAGAVGLVPGGGMLITGAVDPAAHTALLGVIVCVVGIMAGAVVSIVKTRTERPPEIRFAETQRKLARRLAKKDPASAMKLHAAGTIAASRKANAATQDKCIPLLEERSGGPDIDQAANSAAAIDKPLRVVGEPPGADDQEGLRGGKLIMPARRKLDRRAGLAGRAS